MSNLYNLGQYELEFCPDETLLNYVAGTTNTVELVLVGMALLSRNPGASTLNRLGKTPP